MQETQTWSSLTDSVQLQLIIHTCVYESIRCTMLYGRHSTVHSTRNTVFFLIKAKSKYMQSCSWPWFRAPRTHSRLEHARHGHQSHRGRRRARPRRLGLGFLHLKSRRPPDVRGRRKGCAAIYLGLGRQQERGERIAWTDVDRSSLVHLRVTNAGRTH